MFTVKGEDAGGGYFKNEKLIKSLLHHLKPHLKVFIAFIVCLMIFMKAVQWRNQLFLYHKGAEANGSQEGVGEVIGW